MSNEQLDEMRGKLDQINLEILELINKRAELVQETGQVKEKQGANRSYDPVRERDMLNLITKQNNGPFDNSTIVHIFKEIFKAGLDLQEDDHSKALLVSRKKKPEDTIIDINGEKFGDGKQHFIFGPCAVETYDQVA